MVGLDSRDEVQLARMRAAIAEAVTAGAARLRSISAPAVVGVLSASALAPVIAAAAGAGLVLTAGMGVLGSVGANVLTAVVTDAIARVRGGSRTEVPLRQVQEVVAGRIEAAFRSTDPADRELRAEVIELFQVWTSPERCCRLRRLPMTGRTSCRAWSARSAS